METIKQNPFEEALTTPRERKPMSLRKKATLIIIPIAFVLIAVVSSVLVSRNNKLKEENRYVEFLTKDRLVWYQSVGSLYKAASDDLHTKINDNNVSSSGYVGEGANPEVWEWYIQDQIKALNHLLSVGRWKLFDNNLSNLESANDTLGTQWYHDLEGFKECWNNTRIILSKRSGIGTDGDVKMWHYTELNSGVDFTAARYSDNMFETKMTEEGSSKAYEQYIEPYASAFDDELIKYKQLVEKKKQQDQYESDVIGAMIGASILGGLF